MILTVFMLSKTALAIENHSHRISYGKFSAKSQCTATSFGIASSSSLIYSRSESHFQTRRPADGFSSCSVDEDDDGALALKTLLSLFPFSIDYLPALVCVEK